MRLRDRRHVLTVSRNPTNQHRRTLIRKGGEYGAGASLVRTEGPITTLGVQSPNTHYSGHLKITSLEPQRDSEGAGPLGPHTAGGCVDRFKFGKVAGRGH